MQWTDRLANAASVASARVRDHKQKENEIFNIELTVLILIEVKAQIEYPREEMIGYNVGLNASNVGIDRILT